MYARIARFEGGDPAGLDDQIAEMRSQLESGEPAADAPEEARTLMETVSRVMQLVDRKTGASVGIIFCDSEEKMSRADAALNRMSPPGDSGIRRTAVDIYEVAIDKSF
jgi:hypothetical protein